METGWKMNPPARIDGICGAILAGGESRRFGQNKALALLGGKPVIRHVLDPLQNLFNDVMIITHQPALFERFDVDVAADVLRGPGALGGLLTALVHANCEYCFVVACDMPFLNVAVIHHMLVPGPRRDVLVPVRRGEPQPLHALYSRRCIPFIHREIFRGHYRIIDFFAEVAVEEIEEDEWMDLDPESRSFFNVNQPDDFAEAQKWLKEKMP
jgi:molybdopterin-guanine dinucleotide biosynthesis protein A